MADSKISLLPAAGALTGAEIFAAVQDTVTKRTTLPTLEVLQGTKIVEVFRPFTEAGAGVSELQNVCNIVNAFAPFTVPVNQAGVISFLQFAGGVFGTEFTKFSYLLKVGAGTYGLAETQLVPANLIKLAPITTIPEADFIYDVGNIGATAIHTFVNGAGPYVVNGLTVFEGIQNGDDKVWLFVAGNGNYGTGATATVANDFVDLTAQDPIPSTPTFFLPVKKIETTPYAIIAEDINRPLWFTSNNQVVNVPTAFLTINTNILLYDFEAYFSGTGTHTVNHPQGGVDTFSQGDYIKALRYDNAGDTLWVVKQWFQDGDGIPTLQQVTDAGNETNTPIVFLDPLEITYFELGFSGLSFLEIRTNVSLFQFTDDGMFHIFNFATGNFTALGSLSTADRTIQFPDASGTVALTDDIPATPTEEQIIGTAIENAAVTGTYNLDLSTFSDALLNLTGNTIITVTNTPAAGKSFVKTLEITSAVAETLTLPVAWIVIGEYDPAEINYLTIKFSNYTTAGEKVLVEITQ